VKVTGVPSHMVVADGTTTTEGANELLTVMVMEFEVAVVGEAQVALDVITQVMTSPFAKAPFV
jgi:hypothetical protein